MSQTPEEVAALFQSRLGIGKVVPEPNENGGDDEDDEATVAARLTDEERTFRTDKLKEVLATLQNYWAAGDERSFEELAAIAAKIGDGARERKFCFCFFYVILNSFVFLKQNQMIICKHQHILPRIKATMQK